MSLPPPDDFGEERAPQPLPTGLTGVAVALGSVALLVAMATDALAVLGRHFGFPLLGALELVQASVSVAGACAIVCASAAGAHAVIHAVLDRVSPASRAVLAPAGQLLGAAFFLVLAVGCGWIAWDLRAAAEATDLLGIPLAPLRLFATFALIFTATLFVRTAARRA
ncbi:Tripartite ATP-independent transporter, DctQ component [Sphingomonas guangdongensis]|uniref:TRAP transporter small permease protein n=1 Tax=Sphingomonas guangdongensis TaxID=1141890 RepID=A0A285R2Z1_9SPHN|nr:TRAP transporter small permease subunit [Sphingomonas guangdongensis]SOB88244.1 Tripartite ATP-independent transporter, DctQ component [Sphingomonas guangdongensis]